MKFNEYLENTSPKNFTGGSHPTSLLMTILGFLEIEIRALLLNFSRNSMNYRFPFEYYGNKIECIS